MGILKTDGVWKQFGTEEVDTSLDGGELLTGKEIKEGQEIAYKKDPKYKRFMMKVWSFNPWKIRKRKTNERNDL